MARGFRTQLRTASAPQHPPFHVEIVNNRDILCHVGRVFEPLSSSVYGQSQQKSWTANQGKYTSKGLPSHRGGRLELKYFNYGVKTGSARIHFKGTSSLASHGRSDADSATNYVGENGYVKWLRQQAPEDNYIVLHREVDTEAPDTGKWCISAVASGDVLDTDIVIAYISNGTIVRQVWKSDVTYGTGGGGGGGVVDNTQPHPFQIVKDVEADTVYVREGTVNNVVASYPTVGAGNYTFWLQTYPTPVVNMQGGSTNESQCWIQIGRVERSVDPQTQAVTIEVFQYLRNSIWVERYKCGSDPAKYWHSAI